MRFDTPVLAFDVDNVIFDFARTFAAWMEEEHGHAPTVDVSVHCRYDFSNVFPWLDDAERMAYVKAFLKHERFGEMIEVEGVREGLACLRELEPERPHIAITSCGLAEDTHRRRLANLASFALDHIEILPLGHDKIEEYNRLPPGSIVLDDLPRHVAEAEQAGHVGVLFTRPWNRDHDVRHRVSGWPEFLERVPELLDAARRMEMAEMPVL